MPTPIVGYGSPVKPPKKPKTKPAVSGTGVPLPPLPGSPPKSPRRVVFHVPGSPKPPVRVPGSRKPTSIDFTPPSRPTPPPRPTVPPLPPSPAQPTTADIFAPTPESTTFSEIASELEHAGESPEPKPEPKPETDPAVRIVRLASDGLNTIVAGEQSVLNSMEAEAGRPVRVARASPVPFPDLPFDAPDEQPEEAPILEADGDEKDQEPAGKKEEQDVSPALSEYSEVPSESGTVLGNRAMNQYIRDQALARFGPSMPRLGLRAPSVGLQSTAPSQWSMMARYRQPIGRATIVQLKQIKRRMGAKVELFSDASMLGFDRKHWETKLFKKHPLDFSEGFKKNLGAHIKTNLNKKKNSLSFIARRKATPYQLNALIGYIEGKTPPFHYLTIFRKAKVFEEVYNLISLQDLRVYIENELLSTSSIHIKITW